MSSTFDFKIPDYTLMIENATTATIQDVGQAIEKEAKATAPVVTGNYKNNIKFDGIDEVTAHANYSAALEYGIQKPVIIRPKNASVLHFITKDGNEVFAKYVQQRTTNPNPILRNAARKVQQRVGKMFYENMRGV